MNETNLNSESVAERPHHRRRAASHVFNITKYWFRLVAQPLLAVVFIVMIAFLFGYAQRSFNWFNDARSSEASVDTGVDSLYACSMLCVFVKAPGRCPVCGMELQEIEMTGDPKDIFGVTIEPAARRLSNIKTVAALNLPYTKEIEALGKITYDETSEATISAYVDGRIVDLLVDYTGAKVTKGQELAVLYSPDLYSDQVGLLSAKKALQESKSDRSILKNANQRMYENSRQRLIEFGIPESEIDIIEERGKPDSRVRIVAPMSGTVVEKLVDEGKYIKTGMPILRIADLSKVWLILKMFPEETSNLKIGQSVTVSIQSQAGKQFAGRVSFIDPVVDSRTQTVNVRVVIPNDSGLVKIGDYGKAKIQSSSVQTETMVVVPREAVLINGDDSVAYVETERNRFEFRKVEIAEISGDAITLANGIKPGEMVVASGVFMLDSTFNIQGKVSIIDPTRNEGKLPRKSPANRGKQISEDEQKEIDASFTSLSAEDRKLAELQVICPVSEVRLGTKGMGTPIKVDIKGSSIMICCEGCRSGVLEEPEKNLKILMKYHQASVNNPYRSSEASSSGTAPGKSEALK